MHTIRSTNISQQEEKTKYLFETRRESNFAGMRCGPGDLFSNIPPTFTNTSTRNNVLAIRPTMFFSLNPLNDLPKKLGKHGRPRGGLRMRASRERGGMIKVGGGGEGRNSRKSIEISSRGRLGREPPREKGSAKRHGGWRELGLRLSHGERGERI